MNIYAKNYLAFFGYDISDFIPCECCGAKSVDFHHIQPRSKFGKNNKEMQDRVENIMAMCRNCHTAFGEYKQYKEQLQTIHNLKMNIRLKELHGEPDEENKF